MTRAWSRGRITGTSKGLQLLRYPRSKPICATRPVSEHDQPHMRSPLIAAAPRSRFRRAGLREDENHSRKRHFRPWLATVRLPGSARTDQVLGADGITLVYSLGNLHRNAFDNDTGGHGFPYLDHSLSRQCHHSCISKARPLSPHPCLKPLTDILTT